MLHELRKKFSFSQTILKNFSGKFDRNSDKDKDVADATVSHNSNFKFDDSNFSFEVNDRNEVRDWRYHLTNRHF